MQAKRDALEAIGKKQQEAENRKKEEDENPAQDCSPKGADAQNIEGSPYKSPYSRVLPEIQSIRGCGVSH
jgi:hypothetical protein